MSLATEFIQAFERKHGTGAAAFDGLEEVLGAALAGAHARWPALELDPEPWLAFLAERATAAEPVRWLREAPVADWALVFAAARRDPLAIGQFAEVLVKPLCLELQRLSGLAPEDLRQMVLERLFVGEPPGILQYAGRGSLAAWVRVVATRLALNATRSRQPEPVGDEALLELPGGDPTMGYLRQRYAREVQAAFAPAFAALAPRERTVLRQRFLDGLSIEALARLHEVHVATIARWLAHAREQLGDGIRNQLGERLKISPVELESLIRLVRSQLELNLSQWLATR